MPNNIAPQDAASAAAPGANSPSAAASASAAPAPANPSASAAPSTVNTPGTPAVPAASATPAASAPASPAAPLPAVLLVHCHYRLPGGEDSVFLAERDLLLAHGHRVVCYERSNAELDGSALKKLLLPFSAVYSFKTAREIRALIAREKIDLVHVHNTFSVLSPSVFSACRAAGVPVVQTLHNFRLLCPNGVFLRPAAGAQQICELCPQKGLLCAVKNRCYRGSAAQSAVAALVLWVHRRLGTYRRVHTIAITPFDRDKFLQYNARLGLFDPDKMHLKPHPVVGSGEPALPAQKRTGDYLFVGRLEELKGVRTLLQAWQLLPAPQPILNVAGDGPLEGWARDFCQKNNLDNVHFLGRVPHSRLPGVIRQCRAVLVPSLCYESFGLAAAEALVEGTPVLGSDLGNTGAFICRPGEQNPDSPDAQKRIPVPNGLRFAPGNAGELAALVQRLENGMPSFDYAAIQADARQKFGADENYAALLAIYRKMLAER